MSSTRTIAKSKDAIANSKPSRLASNNSQLNVLSIFSGCGGMDLGFEGGFLAYERSVSDKSLIEKELDGHWVKLKKTRFKTVFANDIFEDARKAWTNHFEKSKSGKRTYQAESIVDLVKRHKSGVQVFPSNIDLVTGGFPCQDFSIAGKRKGFSSHKSHTGELLSDSEASVETRGQLYMWMKEVIELTKPKVFVAENVKGLVNLSNVKAIIQNDFSSSDGNGYLVLEPQVLHAANYGIPQNRERVIFIGIRKSALKPEALKALTKKQVDDAYYPYPGPTHNFKIDNSDLQDYVRLNEILDCLEEPETATDPSQRYFSKAKFMGKHCQGQKEINWNGIAPTIRSEHHGNIEFRRLSSKNEGKFREELSIGMKERRLTPRECALIQSFPPDFEFVKMKGEHTFEISPSKAYKMIGNAVPPLLAYHLAKRLELIWPRLFD